MLSETKIYEAVKDAMSIYASMNNGKIGLSKTDLRRYIEMRGGNKDDLHRAMIVGLVVIAPKCNITVTQ